VKRWLAALALWAAIGAGSAPALEHQTVTHAGKRFLVFQVDPLADDLRLFWKGPDGKPLSTLAALEKHVAASGDKLLWAMNAGMYHGNLDPVGLHIENGRLLRPLNLARGEGNFFWKPNGIFLVTPRGASVLQATPALRLPADVRLATQSGPMLVIDGQIHPGFRASSTSRLTRNGVGIRSPRDVRFVMTDNLVNLHEFAAFFRDGLGCHNALYLDGTISSRYTREPPRSDFRMPLGPMIGIVARP
jgi:uncharacterized protein YigE (DUF2233 family)